MTGRRRLRWVLTALVASVALLTPVAACTSEEGGTSTGAGGNAGPFKNIRDNSCNKDETDRTKLVKQAQTIGKDLNKAKFGNGHWDSLRDLWTKESGWFPKACNAKSGACGIPQALPCGKMTDRTTRGQIKWGLNYIKERYGNPSNALEFWKCTTHKNNSGKWVRIRDYCQSAGGARGKASDKKYTWY